MITSVNETPLEAATRRIGEAEQRWDRQIDLVAKLAGRVAKIFSVENYPHNTGASRSDGATPRLSNRSITPLKRGGRGCSVLFGDDFFGR